MDKPKTPDEELENERRRLTEMLEDGIRSIDAGKFVTKEEMRERLDAIRGKPLPKRRASRVR